MSLFFTSNQDDKLKSFLVEQCPAYAGEFKVLPAHFLKAYVNLNKGKKDFDIAGNHRIPGTVFSIDLEKLLNTIDLAIVLHDQE